MTPSEARHISYSFGRVFPFHARLTTVFYDTLFELAPEVRSLFPEDLSAQKEKLATTLKAVVDNLAHLDAILPQVRALGERHRYYGATEAHYEVVALALITALKKVTPGGLSKAEEQSWVAAYTLLADAMIAAAKSTAELRKTG